MEKDQEVSHYKYQVVCNFLIGQPFGTFFRLKDNQTHELEILDKFEDIGILETFYAGEDNEADVMGEEQQDNRNINVNLHQAQKVSYEEIE